MIEPISSATAATAAGASPSLQNHAQAFKPAAPDASQAKNFAQHLSPKAADPAGKPLQLTANTPPAEPHPIREQLSQISKRIESRLTQYDQLEGDLQKVTDTNDLSKSFSVIGKMAKETAVGHAYMQFGVATAGASVSLFQNLMRVSER